LVHIEYVLHSVSGSVECPIQHGWDFIHAFLDVLARLRIESDAPAFEQNDIQGSLDEGPFGLRETISLAVKQTFIEARDTYIIRSRAIYVPQRTEEGKTEWDIMSAWEPASA
jgi:hypothetical protein